MPDISLIPEVTYDPLQPYHNIIDNLPLSNILLRLDLVNTATDVNTQILTDAVGTAGTLANRLNASLDGAGNLIPAAVDLAMHNIASHTDGSISLSPSDISLIDPLDVYSLPSVVSFVRMLDAERNKLFTVADNATSLQLQIYSDLISSAVLFDNDTVNIVDSDTITWEVDAPNTVKANMVFPASAAHQHLDNLTPVPVNIVTPDYINYKVTSMSTQFVDGSLKVYINGVRIFEDGSVYVPNYSATPTYTLKYFTSSPSTGTFSLNTAITSSDVIRIDFIQSLF